MKKNLRRITILVTAQTAYNLDKMASMENTSTGRVVDKLVRDRMLYLKKPVYRTHEDAGERFSM